VNYSGSEDPNDFADLTGHPRQYPAIFTFNLLTVQAEEIAYDQPSISSTRLEMFIGRMRIILAQARTSQIRLDGLKPSFLRDADRSRVPTDFAVSPPKSW